MQAALNIRISLRVCGLGLAILSPLFRRMLLRTYVNIPSTVSRHSDVETMRDEASVFLEEKCVEL